MALEVSLEIPYTSDIYISTAHNGNKITVATFSNKIIWEGGHLKGCGIRKVKNHCLRGRDFPFLLNTLAVCFHSCSGQSSLTVKINCRTIHFLTDLQILCKKEKKKLMNPFVGVGG